MFTKLFNSCSNIAFYSVVCAEELGKVSKWFATIAAHFVFFSSCCIYLIFVFFVLSCAMVCQATTGRRL